MYRYLLNFGVGFIVPLVLVALFLFSTHSAYAIICGPAPCLGFQFPGGYTFNDGAKIIFNNSTSPTDTTDDTIDKVNVKVTSTDSLGNLLDTISLTLTETGPDTGIYMNTNLYFGTGDTQLPVGRTITVSQGELDGNPNCDGSVVNASAIDAVCVSVTSTTDPVGIPNFRLTETSIDSQVFAAKLNLISGATSGNAIKVSPGDVLQITYLGEILYSLIVPNSDPGLAVIRAADCPDSFTFTCDTIDATLSSLSASVPVTVGAGGGGGGGGLIRPVLVLDALAAIGGSPYIVSPPSFGGGYYHYSDGLIIAQGDTKTTFDTSKYNQDLQRQVMVAGTPVNMTFKTFEAYNPTGVVHMGLYIIPRGDDMITSNSLASIVWEKGKLVEVNDPNHILSNATASSDSDGKFQYTQFSFIPTKSYDRMSFLVRAWNDHRYSTDIRVHDEVPPQVTPYDRPYWLHIYDNLHDADLAVEGAGYLKPHIFSHVSIPDQVWNQNGGTVVWFYDEKNQAVALESFDPNKNLVWAQSELLQKQTPSPTQGPDASYAGNHLNRQDTTAIANAEKEEQDRVDTTLQMMGYPVYWNHNITR